MTSSRSIRIGAALALTLAFAGQALAWDFIVESRSGGKNYANYTDVSFSGPSSVKSSAAGCTAGIGCRYATGTAAKATYTFVAPATGTYEVFVTWPTSTNGDNATIHTVYYEGGSTPVTLDQNSAAGLNNKWNSLGSWPFVAGKTYTVEQTNPTLEAPSGATARLMADAVKWTISCACSSVPEVSTKAPHMAGDTKVRVTGIDSNATKVTVYINGISAGSVTLAGAGASPSETDVTVAALAAGQRINATQTLTVCDPAESKEGCVGATGKIVGDCAQIAAVTAQPVIVTTDTTVLVTGVDPAAKAVKVYANGAAPALGTLNNPVPAAPDNRVSVPVAGLQNGQIISATQVLQSVGGSAANLEGCIPAAGPEVGNCNEVTAVTVAGLVSKDQTKVRVSGVSATASAVKVYANDGTTDTLIGTNSAPGGAGTVVVTVSPALVLGQTIKATQVVKLEGCMPTAGRRVMDKGIIEDFEDSLSYDYGAPTAPKNRMWYNVSNTAWTTLSQPNPGPSPFTSKVMDLIDGGWGNGVYAVYDQVIPENGKTWHLEADMLVDERSADTDLYRSFQMGVVVNGAHRDPSGALPDITATVGDYFGLTSVQDGVGIETAVQTVYTNSFTANQGDNLLIALATSCKGYNVSKTASPASPGMMIDNIRLVEGEPPCVCGRVGPVTINTGPLEAGQTNVTVSGISIDPMASKVTVYSYDGGSIWTKLGEVAPAAATAIVNVTPLVKGQTLVATQTLNTCVPSQEMEGCKGRLGPVVGLGKNTALLVTLGIRETGGTGPVGVNGGITGEIEWLGASSAVSGAPQGKKIPVDPAWQTLTFTPGVDKVLSAGLTTGSNGVLDGTWGVLEHLAFALDTATPNTGRYTIYIDNIYNGTTPLTDFEAAATATKVIFANPNVGTPTSANLLTPPNMSEVSEDEHDGTGTKSLKISFQFVDAQQKRWVRVSSVNLPAPNTQALPNPLINLTQPITMRVLLKGAKDCGAVFADRDKDGDVDQVDFGAFQTCYTGTIVGVVADCECFDRDGDGKIDAADLNAFTKCWSGPTIKAESTCDD